MSGKRDRAEYTPEDLRQKATVLRRWADSFAELAQRVEELGIDSVGLRFENNLFVGSERINSFLVDGIKTLNELEFQSKAPKPSLEAESAAQIEELKKKQAKRTKKVTRKKNGDSDDGKKSGTG